MALVLKDRVQETSTTTGTGTLTLDGAVTGYQSFGSAIGSGNTTFYGIYLNGGSEWEVGLGTVGSGTLARTTVLASSNAGSAVDFSAGQKSVWCDYPAAKAVFYDASNVVNVTTLNASTTVKSPYFDAVSSAGGALRNASGTNQIQWGSGGGNNISLDVSTNMNGTNAQIDISPTGTGHVHIKPTGSGSIEIAPTNAGTMNNVVVGGTTPLAVTGTTVTATTQFSGAGTGLTGTASGLSIGGNAATATVATTALWGA